MFEGRRGQVVELLYFVVIMFVLAFMLVVVYSVFSYVNSFVQSSDLFPSESKDVMQESTDTYLTLDKYMPLVMVAFIIGVLALAFASTLHPVFLGVYVLLSVLGVFVSGILAQLYQEAVSVEPLATAAASTPVTTSIMSNFPLIFFVTSLVAGVVAFKLRSWQVQ